MVNKKIMDQFTIKMQNLSNTKTLSKENLSVGGDLVLALKLFVHFGSKDLTALSSRQRGRHTYACVVVVPLCLELKLIRHKGGASLRDVGRKLQKHKVHKYASHIA